MELGIKTRIIILMVASALIQASSKDVGQQLEDSLDELIPTLLACRKLAGVSIAVVRGMETIFIKGYGRVDLDEDDAVTKNTLFGIASLSKAFTATLLGKLLATSKQRYTWDTSIRSILGNDFYLYDRIHTENITIKDLLTHRTGYPSYNSIRHQSALNRYRLVQKMRFLKPTLPFRGQYKYNNLMYGLLTYLTELIGGDTWENLMNRHIFEPLNMTSSTFIYQIELARKDLAKSYKVDYDGNLRQVSPQYHSYWGKIGGSGSVVSNAVDISKWLKALLNKGKAEDGSDVIPEEVIQDCQKPYESIRVSSWDIAYLRPAAPVSYTHFSYGLAWRIGFYRGWRTIHHTGTSMGYLGQITLVPDLGLGIFTSLTGDDPGYTSRRHIHLHVMDLLMGESPWLNTSTACTMPQGGKLRSDRIKNENRIPSDTDLSLYEGTYGNFAFGNITFYANRSHNLIMTYGDLGVWDIRPKIGLHRFDAVGTGHVWNWDFSSLNFQRSHDGATGPLNQVVVFGMEPSSPPVFRRNQKMFNIPPAPRDACAAVSYGAEVKVTSKTMWIVTVVSIVRAVRYLMF